MQITMEECHINTAGYSSHTCNERCTLYPIQNDGNSCGVIAIIMATIAMFKPEYFAKFTTKNKRNYDKPFCFLSNPTRYRRLEIKFFMVLIEIHFACSLTVS